MSSTTVGFFSRGSRISLAGWYSISRLLPPVSDRATASGRPAFTLNSTVTSYGSSAFNFNIGGGGVFNASGDPFLGSIDEVALFDKALTAVQVQELYYSANIAPQITTQPDHPRYP